MSSPFFLALEMLFLLQNSFHQMVWGCARDPSRTHHHLSWDISVGSINKRPSLSTGVTQLVGCVLDCLVQHTFNLHNTGLKDRWLYHYVVYACLSPWIQLSPKPVISGHFQRTTSINVHKFLGLHGQPCWLEIDSYQEPCLFSKNRNPKSM